MLRLPENLPPAIRDALTEYAEHHTQENYGSGIDAMNAEATCKPALCNLSSWCDENAKFGEVTAITRCQMHHISDQLYRLKAEAYVDKMTTVERAFLDLMRRTRPVDMVVLELDAINALQKRVAPNEGANNAN